MLGFLVFIGVIAMFGALPVMALWYFWRWFPLYPGRTLIVVLIGIILLCIAAGYVARIGAGCADGKMGCPFAGVP